MASGWRRGRAAGLDLPPAYEPPGQPTEIAPRLIELCFQTAGVWELGTSRPHGPADARGPGGALRGRCRERAAVRGGPSAATATASTLRCVDENGRVRMRLEGYRTVELPGGLDPEALDPIRAAME